MSDTTEETKPTPVVTDHAKAPEVEVEAKPGPAAPPSPPSPPAPADGVVRDANGNAIRHLRNDEIARMNELARKV